MQTVYSNVFDVVQKKLNNSHINKIESEYTTLTYVVSLFIRLLKIITWVDLMVYSLQFLMNPTVFCMFYVYCLWWETCLGMNVSVSAFLTELRHRYRVQVLKVFVYIG